jgi:hypothetical protein
MTQRRFGTAIACIDGRMQQPMSLWLQARYGLDYVDVVSEPGPDKLLAEGEHDPIAAVRAKVSLSVVAHASTLVAVCGHHDCAANPASVEEHWMQIRAAVHQVRSWGLAADVLGLWINYLWQVEIIERSLQMPQVNPG